MRRLAAALVLVVVAGCGSDPAGPERPVALASLDHPDSYVPVLTPDGHTVWRSDVAKIFYADSCDNLQPWSTDEFAVLLGGLPGDGWVYRCED